MDPNTRAMILGAAGASGAAATYIEDTFSSWLYAGTGSTQTITNGIDLTGKDGMVWIKSRSEGTSDNNISDTVRGNNKTIKANTTAAEVALIESYGIQHTSSGFTVQSGSSSPDARNNSGVAYASWTFRKAAKFFDVVSYYGNNTNRTIAHNLASVPGCIIIKRLQFASDWQVYHRSLSNTEYMVLNTTAAKASGTTRWNSTTATSTDFSLGTDVTVNTDGNYIAYLFAHDAGGFGDTGADNVISCGSYTGNGSATGPTVTLGWEPQWLLIKRSDSTGDWNVLDSMRGFVAGAADAELNPNLNVVESSGTFVTPLPTGFQVNTTDTGYNANTGTYIYIAIRRGPMKTPTDATKVFQPKLYTGTNVDNRLVTTDIVTDMAWVRQRNSTTVAGMVVGDRLRGQPYSLTGSTAVEVNDANSFDQEIISTTEYGTAFSSMTGFWVGADATSSVNVNTTSNNHLAYAFRRAPGFFDVVAYTGDGVAGRTVTHNLGAKPLINMVKRRDVGTGSWTIYTDLIDGSLDFLQFDNTTTKQDSAQSVPTSTVFSVSSGSNVNASGSNYIAFLFGSVAGVSKCGVYTGTGTTLDIDCGFAAGARFVLIKRTDVATDWYVWDTARGIVAAADPYLLPNSTATENTANDYIDPLNAGFQISSTAPASINGSGGTFLYLAIA